MIRVLLFACLFAVCGAAEDESPWAKDFAKYRVERPLFLAPHVDVGSHPLGEKFRTRITEAVKEGPNFGGHLAIVQWGCGTGCIQWVVVDLRSGTIHADDELLTLAWDPSFDAAGVEDYLTFRADSTLLIVHGLAGEENAKPTRYFLRWDGKRFERLAIERPVTPVPAR